MAKKGKETSKQPTEKALFKLEIKKVEQGIKAYKSERKASWTEFKNQMKLELSKLKVQMKMLETI